MNTEPARPLEAAKTEVQRKSLDQRQQLDDLMRLRHSCAHILATAVLRLWPDARLDIGPPTDEGFYYDFDLGHRFSPEDFPRIEEAMRAVIKENQVFEKSIRTREEARAYFEARGQRFKIERLADIPDDEPISFYQNGEFVDLCAGPHVMRTGNVKPGAVKLLKVASAYFKGNERNPQLQRLYGTAFKTKDELEAWLQMQEEARRRDHRRIGAEMGLFAFDAEYVGPGLPLWLPNGTVLVEELERLAKETEFQAGYVRVRTPHLAREKMYRTSGHLPYYEDSMFPAMEMLEEEERKLRDKLLERRADLIQLRDGIGHATSANTAGLTTDQLAHDISRLETEITFLGGRYYLKAMNCPHHHRIFAAEPRSYRDLPLRLAEYGTCYRYEQSGELFGLMRVRSMNMNDAHLYCTPEQFADEFRAVNEMYLKYFKIFGLDRCQMRFSTHDPARLGQKFVNEPELWLQTEEMVRRVLVESGIQFVEVPNEAAFYGPKIDVQVWSAIGREFTIATNQVDFAVPRRFGLTYRDRDNTDKTPLCIHRAPLGTHERFIGFLIEHYAGNFPLWLAPEQVRLLTLGNEAPLVNYARGILEELRARFVRVEGDFGTNPIKAKIADAEKARVHTMLVIGGRDLDAGVVSVRLHSRGPQGARPRDEVIADIVAAIQERRS
ncbi:MAG: threonine--tRNA ligase [Verrucomicrobiae bacterium]|nr:threonine--tRNA ligase [Verrucomicrobiae bacterium]